MINTLQSLELDQLVNLAEGILWVAIALVFLFRLSQTKQNRDLAIICVFAFMLFGVSDFIEVYTRAWYQPAALFILKACCIVTFVVLYIVYRRRHKNHHDEELK